MRIAATAATLLFALASCSTTEHTVSPYQQPNELMSSEINQRIDQIPFQHREELIQNLLWLSQTGEQTIPALLRGLQHENPKVRSSCCWVLGRLRDRRTVDNLRTLVTDDQSSVRLEAARTLVLMGDLDQSPSLIEGLDSERKEVRYMCHEALKSATGHDFGYDHLNESQQDMQLAVLRWRQWWGEYGGDTFFASSYEQAHGLNNLAAPGGETKLEDQSTPDSSNSEESSTEESSSEGSSGESASTESTESAEIGAEGGSEGAPPSIPAVVPTTEESSTEESASTESTGTESPGTESPGTESTSTESTGTESPGTESTNTESTESGTSGSQPPATTEVPVVVPVTVPVTAPPATGGNGNGGN